MVIEDAGTANEIAIGTTVQAAAMKAEGAEAGDVGKSALISMASGFAMQGLQEAGVFGELSPSTSDVVSQDQFDDPFGGTLDWLVRPHQEGMGVGGPRYTSKKLSKLNGYGEKVVARWGPATGSGPLPVKVAETFRGGSYTELVTNRATTLYRAYGGKAGELSGYWSRVKPTGNLQAKLDSALLSKWGNTARLRTHNQNMTVAARAMAERKTSGQRSYRVATRRQSFRRPNMISIRLRRL